MKKIFTVIILTYFVSTSYSQKLYSWLIVPEYNNSKVKVYSPGATATHYVTLNCTGYINNINGVVLVGNDLYIASAGNSVGSGNNLRKYPNFVAAAKAGTFIPANITDAFAGVTPPGIIGIIEKNGVIYTSHVDKIIATTISNGNQNTLINIVGKTFANLAFDYLGNLWITEYSQDQILLILSSNLAMATNTKAGFVQFEHFVNPTLPSSNTNSNLQTASKTYISRPEGIDFDNDGNMYVANNNDNGFNNWTSIVKFSKTFLNSIITITTSTAGISANQYNGTLSLNDAQIFNVPSFGASNSQLGGLKIDKNMNCLYVNEEIGNAGFSIDIEKLADISNNYNDIKLNISSTNPGNGGIFKVDNGLFCSNVANPVVNQTFYFGSRNLTTSDDKVVCKSADVTLNIGTNATMVKNSYFDPVAQKTKWINSVVQFTFKASDYFWGRITTNAVGQCGSTTKSNMSNYMTDDSIKILRQPTDIIKPALNSTQNFNFDVTSYDNGNLMYLPVGFRWYRENVSSVHQFDSFVDGVTIPNLKIAYSPGYSTVTDTLTFNQVNYLGEGKYYCIATNHCNSVQTNLVNLIMKSRLNVLMSVSIPNQISSILNADLKTVDITMPFGTNVSSLVPTLTYSQFATCTPNSGVAQNFTNPIPYTILAEDGTTTVTYMVKVILAPFEPLAGKEILTFSIPNQVGASVINSANATIDVTMPAGTNVTSLVPTFTLSTSATAEKGTGVAQDFTNPVVYKITAQDQTIKNWTVKVTVEANSALVNNSQNNILAYPNPFFNELNIRENTEVKVLEIYTILGNKMYEIDNLSKEIKIDTKNWNSGIYFIKTLQTNGVSQIQKFNKID